MKKFTNLPSDLVYESMLGFAAAHAALVSVNMDPLFVMRRQPVASKVALISGGGSGHEPLPSGFVGTGMLDTASRGQVFTSPTPNQMLAAAKAVGGAAGVLFIVKNYAGDVMNFQMAMDMMDIEFASVLVNDDVPVDSSGHAAGRRGVAGTLVVEKMVGAAAERGRPLAALKSLGDSVNARTRSMGVALTSCTVPAAGTPTFALGETEMEMGVGIHGEPGRRRVPLAPARAIATEMAEAILHDLAPKPGTPALLFLNGFGATPALELYLMYENVRAVAEARGLTIARSLVGSYVTSLDMAGCSITVTLLDDELVGLWDAPVHTAALRWRL